MKKKKLIKFGLVFLSLVGLCISSGVSFAKYRDENYGNGNAGTAKFEILANMKDGSNIDKIIDLTYATTEQGISWSFSVVNNSEVLVNDKIMVTIRENVPDWLGMAMSVNGNLISYSSNEDGSYIYECDLGINEKHEWELTFTGNPETAESLILSVSISVIVEQKI